MTEALLFIPSIGSVGNIEVALSALSFPKSHHYFGKEVEMSSRLELILQVPFVAVTKICIISQIEVIRNKLLLSINLHLKQK